MEANESRIAQEAKVMTRKEIILKAINKQITWIQASEILGITARHMRRLKWKYEEYGYGGLRDNRAGTPRRKRIAVQTLEELCRLKREVYPDFSVKHFHEYAVEKHKLKISYNWARIVLEEAGIVEKAPARGKHRCRRERRPMRGMLLHLDGSTHTWIPSLPQWDLMVMMDDADGQILYAEFVLEEGTVSTLLALEHVLIRYGRFCELYHDCGSHFGRTSRVGEGPDPEQNGQVSRALKALGIQQIFARSPQARGRSERAFGTLQGRLPQELRLQGIRDYEKANTYLKKVFLPQFNRQFTVKPAQPESAFVPLVGMDLKLLLSIQQQRIVRNDNTVTYKNVILQIPETSQRVHYVRCPVTIHEFPQGTWGISYQGKLLGEYQPDGKRIVSAEKQREVA
jgi:transposase